MTRVFNHCSLRQQLSHPQNMDLRRSPQRLTFAGNLDHERVTTRCSTSPQERRGPLHSGERLGVTDGLESRKLSGPHEYTTVDGTFSEAIVLTIEHISGAPLNRLQISYYGDDRRLSWPRVLTLADTRSVLEKW